MSTSAELDDAPQHALAPTRTDGATRYHLTRTDMAVERARSRVNNSLSRYLMALYMAIYYAIIYPLVPKPHGLWFLLAMPLVFVVSWLYARWRIGPPTLILTQTDAGLEIGDGGEHGGRGMTLEREAIVGVFARRPARTSHEPMLTVFAELRDGRITPIAEQLHADLAHQLVAQLTEALGLAPRVQPPPGLVAITREGDHQTITIWPTRRWRLLKMGALLLFTGLLITAALVPTAQIQQVIVAALVVLVWTVERSGDMATTHLTLRADGWRYARRLFGVPLQRVEGAPHELELDHEGLRWCAHDKRIAWLNPALPASVYEVAARTLSTPQLEHTAAPKPPELSSDADD